VVIPAAEPDGAPGRARGTANRIVHGIDLAAVEGAVRAAEQATTGEIRVALARFYFWGDVRRAAARAFARLRIDRTRERNGVLIFVAPWRRRFAILGDDGIHRRVPGDFWEQVAGPLAQAFRAGDPTSGLVQAIAAIGRQLALHFPPGSGPNPNEIPDEVALDRQRRPR
jgi:uncharacterized membrane protein